GQQIALHQNVIGDCDHVEAPGLPVQIDDLPDGEAAVAPPRVNVKVAQQERLVPRHVTPSHPNDPDPPDRAAGSRTRNSGRTDRTPVACPSPRNAEPTSTPSIPGRWRRAPAE